MQYRMHWIDWEAKKHGLKVIYVDSHFSSTLYPKCGKEMKEIAYRYFAKILVMMDVIAIMNLHGISLILTAPQNE